jgi:hypothetical protein
MEVKVCKKCKRLFNYIYGPELCQDCLKIVPNDDKERIGKELNVILKPKDKEDEEKYDQVRDFVMANPRATVAQIAEVNGIKPSTLLEWVREDRLEFSDNSKHAWFECEKCGIKISSGRLCNRCKIKYKG